MFTLKPLCAAVAILLIPCACLGAGKWSIVPRIYLEEQYDDNLFLSETDEQEDLITTASPGIDLKYESPTGMIDLDYELRRSIYNDFSELNFTGQRGWLEARKEFSPRFAAGIRELFIRSQDPVGLTRVPTFERPSIRFGERRPYTRNVVQPDFTFTFYKDSSIRIGYRNHILNNDAEDVADQDENAVNALLTYSFNVRNRAELFYERLSQDYGPTIPPEPPRDFVGDLVRARYTHNFDPRTSAYFEYRYYQKDMDQETPSFFDYKVHDPKLGFSRALSEKVSLEASAGYAFRDTDTADNQETFTGTVRFSSQYKRLNTEVYGDTGFQDDFRTAESLGFNEFWRAGFRGTYQFLQRLWGDGYFYVERDDYTDIDRTDKYWDVRGVVRYQLLRWLFLSFDYEYFKRNSTAAGQSYTDNRFFGRLTARYDIAEKYQ
ncbi:MAG: outer membrane beta-barrel protein [Deltaproteobacteria bacterium]|nr:outer membrane beta-barrel protein [Deltaproteobacteria bacterium]